MVALGLLLTSGAKLLFAVIFVLLMILFPDVDPGLAVAAAVFAIYAFAELHVMRRAWRGHVGWLSAATIAIGLAIFGAAGFFAGLDPFTEGGFLNLFSAIAAAYVLAAIGWVWNCLQARSVPAA